MVFSAPPCKRAALSQPAPLAACTPKPPEERRKTLEQKRTNPAARIRIPLEKEFPKSFICCEFKFGVCSGKKKVLVVPGAVNELNSRKCRKLLQSPKRVVCVELFEGSFGVVLESKLLKVWKRTFNSKTSLKQV